MRGILYRRFSVPAVFLKPAVQELYVVCDATEIQAPCKTHCDWIGSAQPRSLSLVQHVQQQPTSLDSLATASAQERQVCQEQDPCIYKVMPFVAAKKRPSRRERLGASKALGLFRQRDRLVSRAQILCSPQSALCLLRAGPRCTILGFRHLRYMRPG